ncbi:hypothetical protein BB559_000902 [Furculomyces boomerangus]|uniref:coproporphyrinogen oxidase n=2 Tax=Harpellales TaxID=61421 RepID=A0A2T9Z3S3_9FUNG|nr:hypothetical protein BB559_000902 [Furculomyces boomerangus]PVZ96919.1 hypothetical protein BB558_007154 [Smittium angustum]
MNSRLLSRLRFPSTKALAPKNGYLRSAFYSQQNAPSTIKKMSAGSVLALSLASATAIGGVVYYGFMDKPQKELVEYNKNVVKSQQFQRKPVELNLTPPKFDLESTEPVKKRMEKFVLALQKSLVGNLEALDQNENKKFYWDRWTREDGNGYGISCVLQDSNTFEKAGVNVSVIGGPVSKQQLDSMRARKVSPEIDEKVDYDFWVAGISTVIHPSNPMAPTSHFNYRYFELTKRGDPEHKVVTSWFGGGADLTPSYIFEEDCEHFHQTLKDASDKHDKKLYPEFKKACDEYFTIPHRNETRGIGGTFFDDLNDRPLNELFHLVFDMGFAFQNSYLPIIAKRKDMPFTEEQKLWQQIRRGRYVEFNLINDRGTKFGLFTPGARIESILMSLPLTARWEYMHKPPPGSEEEKLLNALKTPRDWVKN